LTVNNMRLLETRTIMHRLRKPAIVIFALAILIVFALVSQTGAQRRKNRYVTSGLDDVVFAISFSPDGRTLAIARGATEPAQRFGRIELWNTETGKLRLVIQGFDGPVSSVSFSPDGRTIVSGSSEYYNKHVQEKTLVREGAVYGELKWWDVNTGELKRRLKLSGEDEFSPYFDSAQHLARAAYSPDGKQLAVSEYSVEHYLTVSIANPSYIRRLPSFLASLRLLDAQTGEQRVKVRLNTEQPSYPLFSPNSELVALRTEPAPFKIFKSDYVALRNARTGREEHKFKDFKGEPNAIAFSPDSRQLAVASTRYEQRDVGVGNLELTIARSEVTIFDLQTRKVVLRLNHLGAVNSLAFAAGGRFLLIGGFLNVKDGSAPAFKVWDLQAGSSYSFVTSRADASEAVGLMAVSDNGGLVAFQAGADVVKLLDTQTWKVKETWDANSVGDKVERPINRFIVSAKLMLAVGFSADGKTVFGETDRGTIKHWNAETGEVKGQLSESEDNPSLVAVSGNGQSLVEFRAEKVFTSRFGSDTKQLVPLSDGPTVNALAVSGDGKTVAVGRGEDVWLLKTGAAERVLNIQHGPVVRLAFTDDGRAIATVAEDGTIGIWDTEIGRLLQSIAGTGEVTALCFTPDGQILATAAADHSVKLWNLRTGLLQTRFQKHEARVNGLAFSGDGKLLASGGDDRKVVIWDMVSGKVKRTFKGHDQTVTSLAFSPDNRLLASGSGNASIVLWDVASGKLNRVLK
jgi:WD40 repeat protein